MSIIFGGGETPSFTSFNAIESTTSGVFNAPARCAMHLSQGGWIKTTPLVSTGELWFHMDVNTTSIVSGLTPISVLDQSGNALFGIQSSGSILVGNTTIGTAQIFSTTGVSTLDIHLKSGTVGLVEIYVNSQVIFSTSGNYSFTTMQNLMLSPVGTNTNWSQVIVADEITIGFQLATLGFTSSGTNTGWAGPVTAINEIILDTTTYINASTAALTNTYMTSGISTSYTNIKAVVISALARYSTGGGPTNLYADAYIGSTNYTAAMNSIGVGYSPAIAVMNTNPATNVAWTASDINSAEFGIKSKL